MTQPLVRRARRTEEKVDGAEMTRRVFSCEVTARPSATLPQGTDRSHPGPGRYGDWDGTLYVGSFVVISLLSCHGCLVISG